jgi:ABC-type branched-subunit amino acid transport system ATPase component
MSEPVLLAKDVVAGYQRGVDIVRGVTVSVSAGEMVAIVGPNGAGKSTLIKSLCGLLPPTQGSIFFAGDEVTGVKPHAMVRRGVGYVPQRDHIFPRMTVEENLELGVFPFRQVDMAQAKARVFDLFPRLTERRHQPAAVLSGGERQMLALARAVIFEPRLLLLDEPSAGVDPGVVEILWEKIEQIRAEGVPVLMVEQNARRALGMADRGYVLDLGEVRYEGPGHELLRDPAIADLYLGGRPGEARMLDIDAPLT